MAEETGVGGTCGMRGIGATGAEGEADAAALAASGLVLFGWTGATGLVVIGAGFAAATGVGA